VKSGDERIDLLKGEGAESGGEDWDGQFRGNALFGIVSDGIAG
jgi:hypothetical protein